MKGGTKAETLLSDQMLHAMKKGTQRNGRILSYEIKLACYSRLKLSPPMALP